MYLIPVPFGPNRETDHQFVGPASATFSQHLLFLDCPGWHVNDKLYQERKTKEVLIIIIVINIIIVPPVWSLVPIPHHHLHQMAVSALVPLTDTVSGVRSSIVNWLDIPSLSLRPETQPWRKLPIVFPIA